MPLTNAQRGRLIANFQSRCTVVVANINTAITEAKFDRILKKEEDLSWVVDLLLSAVTFGVSSCIKAAAKAIKQAGLQTLNSMAAEARIARSGTFNVGTQGAKLLGAVPPR